MDKIIWPDKPHVGQIVQYPCLFGGHWVVWQWQGSEWKLVSNG